MIKAYLNYGPLHIRIPMWLWYRQARAMLARGGVATLNSALEPDHRSLDCDYHTHSSLNPCVNGLYVWQYVIDKGGR